MFDLFKDVLKVAGNVVVTPLDVAKDVVTLGGAMTEKDEPYTVKRIKKTLGKINDVGDDIEDLLK